VSPRERDRWFGLIDNASRDTAVPCPYFWYYFTFSWLRHFSERDAHTTDRVTDNVTKPVTKRDRVMYVVPAS